MSAEGVLRAERTVTAPHCELEEIDASPTWPFHLFCPLDFLYVFDSHLDVEMLEKSLSAVLASYPVLAGRYVARGARVATTNLGVPLTVATSPGSIRDIPEDPGKGIYCDVRDLQRVADGDEPILTVVLTSFNDGCALGVTMNHGCSDGSSFSAFMRDWSDVHNGKGVLPMHMGLPAAALRLLSDSEVVGLPQTDFAMLSKLLEEYRSESCEKPMRAAKAAAGVAQAARRRMHFSNEALARIKQQAEKGADTWVSTNEALLAHVYTSLLTAAGVQDRTRCGITLSVDLRGKIASVPQRLLGRAVVNVELGVDLSDPATAAANIHHALQRELTEDKLLRRHQLGVYAMSTQIILPGPPKPETTRSIEWNFQGKAPYYQVDFGEGPPVRGVPWNAGEEIKVAPSAQGGMDVFILEGADPWQMRKAQLRDWAEHDFVAQAVALHESN